MQTVIKISCTDQQLHVTKSPKVTSGGVNDITIKFDFCPLWADLTKVALFHSAADRRTIYAKNLEENNTCVIPWEVLSAPGLIYISVEGQKGDTIRTTEEIIYRIHKGAPTESAVKPSSNLAPLIVQETGDSSLKVMSQRAVTEALGQVLSSNTENLAFLIETDMLPAVHEEGGKILTDENGKIILRY